MKIEKIIHKGYTEFKGIRKKYPKMRQHFGKYQYISSNKNGKISLINLPNYYLNGKGFWEINCREGDLFEHSERFDTKEDAEEKIKEYLQADVLEELIEEKLEKIKEGGDESA